MTNSKPTVPNDDSKRKRARRVFRWLAIVLGLLPFLLLEVGLRFYDVGRPEGISDPFVGFSRVFRLFELNDEAGRYQTSRAKLYYFGSQSFAAEKPDGGFRAFCVGGSTVLGHPYQPDTAFSSWLKIELRGRHPDRPIEVVNCGGISYASYRLVSIVKEVLEYNPDLIVAATGHNEFLEERTYGDLKHRPAVKVWMDEHIYTLRTVTVAREGLARLRGGRRHSSQSALKPEVDAKLDHVSGYASYHRDDTWKEAVVAHFRRNLHAMIKLCRKAGVPLVLVNLGSNVRDCPPFKSEHRSGIDISTLAKWDGLFERASVVEADFPAKALAIYREAETLDGEHAQLAYRIARCLDRLGEFDEARQAYIRSKELDVCPIRMLEVMNQAVIEIAEETGTPVVDIKGMLESRSEHDLVGFNWYVDQVHPSIGGHQLIAQEIAETIVQQGLAARNRTWTNRRRRAAYRDHLQSLGARYFQAGQARVGWLEKWARRDRLREDAQPHDARGLFDVGHTQLDFGSPAEARTAYRAALEEDPALSIRLLDHGLILFQQGRAEAADGVLGFLAEHVEDDAIQSDVSIARSLIELEKDDPRISSEQRQAMQQAVANPNERIRRWIDEVPDVMDRLRASEVQR